MKLTVGIFLAAALVLASGGADAEGTSDLTLFSISKSENRNQVVYAIRVDAACRPAGPAPVHAYWQNFEQGPTNTSPLLWIEQPAYGMASQQVESDGQVRIRLRPLPERPIVVRTERSGDACLARAATTVSATAVILYNIHAKLKRLFGIESVTLSGRQVETGAIVHETLKP
jgi:hypothetical protein